MKRLIDVVLSVSIIFFCFPFIAAILSFVFLLTGENPIIFQKRKVALGKREIKLIKIRTIKNSKQFKKQEDACSQIFYKSGYVKYVPLFCRWLRKTGLDEILQVVNVLKGDMSFVGPRPLLKNDLIIMKKSSPAHYHRRTKINSRPGITGCWQVYGDRLKGTANLIELDEVYEYKKSFLLDLRIIIRTIFILMTASHSDSIVTNTRGRNKYVIPVSIYEHPD
jgi:exopolysaccharide production protein ExoY